MPASYLFLNNGGKKGFLCLPRLTIAGRVLDLYQTGRPAPCKQADFFEKEKT